MGVWFIGCLRCDENKFTAWGCCKIRRSRWATTFTASARRLREDCIVILARSYAHRSVLALRPTSLGNRTAMRNANTTPETVVKLASAIATCLDVRDGGSTKMRARQLGVGWFRRGSARVQFVSIQKGSQFNPKALANFIVYPPFRITPQQDAMCATHRSQEAILRFSIAPLRSALVIIACTSRGFAISRHYRRSHRSREMSRWFRCGSSPRVGQISHGKKFFAGANATHRQSA